MPWLIRLATDRPEPSAPGTAASYDSEKQLSIVDGTDVAVIDADGPPQTKKADRESGEDQKARW